MFKSAAKMSSVRKAEDSHEYVTGTFLLAGSEVLQLVKLGLLENPGRAIMPPQNNR